MALIIVVDDDPSIRLLLREALEEHGHTVLEAAEGDACFKHFERGARPDLVITDIFMPGKEGLETVFELYDHWPQIRIIAISAGRPSAPNYLKLAKSLGADRVLPKPFGVNQILEMVNELLTTDKRESQVVPA